MSDHPLDKLLRQALTKRSDAVVRPPGSFGTPLVLHGQPFYARHDCPGCYDMAREELETVHDMAIDHVLHADHVGRDTPAGKASLAKASEYVQAADELNDTCLFFMPVQGSA